MLPWGGICYFALQDESVGNFPNWVEAQSYVFRTLTMAGWGVGIGGVFLPSLFLRSREPTTPFTSLAPRPTAEACTSQVTKWFRVSENRKRKQLLSDHKSQSPCTGARTPHPSRAPGVFPPYTETWRILFTSPHKLEAADSDVSGLD